MELQRTHAIFVWILSLGIIILRFVPLVACINASSPPTAEQHSTTGYNVTRLSIHMLMDIRNGFGFGLL